MAGRNREPGFTSSPHARRRSATSGAPHLQNDAFNHRENDLLLLRVEPGNGFELEPQLIVGAAFVFLEKQQIRAHAERNCKLANDVQRGLRSAALVAPDLRDVNTDTLGKCLLRQAALLAQRGQVLREVESRCRLVSRLQDTRGEQTC